MGDREDQMAEAAHDEMVAQRAVDHAYAKGRAAGLAAALATMAEDETAADVRPNSELSSSELCQRMEAKAEAMAAEPGFPSRVDMDNMTSPELAAFMSSEKHHRLADHQDAIEESILADIEKRRDPERNDRGVNPKDILGLKKVPLNLVPSTSKIHQAMAMKDGAKKYGAYNWREKKVIASIYIAAAARHMEAWYDGEECAVDSGVHHLGHAIACMGIILDAEAMAPTCLDDDRPVPGPAPRLLAEFEERVG